MTTLTKTELRWIISTLTDKADGIRKESDEWTTENDQIAAALCLHYAESYESLTAKLQKTLDHNDKRIAIE